MSWKQGPATLSKERQGPGAGSFSWIPSTLAWHRGCMRSVGSDTEVPGSRKVSANNETGCEASPVSRLGGEWQVPFVLVAQSATY